MPLGGLLEPVKALATNPGALTGNIYLPQNFQADAPLIVVLHGCTQNAIDYATAAGWVELADRNGFALLLPQQQRANNPNLCFNWFVRGDIRRDEGEAASIKAMIDHVIDRHRIDRRRIFITGLSAGAVMAGTMLACYPEIFAGGGLIAGLPHGTASSVPMALDQMRRGPRRSAPELAANVTAASDHQGPWPRISIWHGDADHIVDAVNGDATLAQWLAVHQLEDSSPQSDRQAHVHHRTWRDAKGRTMVEHRTVEGMGHGTPIDLKSRNSVGQAIPFVLDAGIASSEYLLQFWDVSNKIPEAVPVVHKPPANQLMAPRLSRPAPRVRAFSPNPQAKSGVAKVINDALRAAGLIK